MQTQGVPFSIGEAAPNHSLWDYFWGVGGSCVECHSCSMIYCLLLGWSWPLVFVLSNNNGPLYVTSSYSTWIFCRGVSGFATDCPCGVWCRELTTCLLYVCPFFWNGLKQKLECRFDIINYKSSLLLHFDICNCVCLNSWYEFYLYFLKSVLYFYQVLLY